MVANNANTLSPAASLALGLPPQGAHAKPRQRTHSHVAQTWQTHDDDFLALTLEGTTEQEKKPSSDESANMKPITADYATRENATKGRAVKGGLAMNEEIMGSIEVEEATAENTTDEVAKKAPADSHSDFLADIESLTIQASQSESPRDEDFITVLLEDITVTEHPSQDLAFNGEDQVLGYVEAAPDNLSIFYSIAPRRKDESGIKANFQMDDELFFRVYTDAHYGAHAADDAPEHDKQADIDCMMKCALGKHSMLPAKGKDEAHPFDDGSFSEEPPTAKSAGTHYVHYKVAQQDDLYYFGSFPVTIRKAQPTPGDFRFTAPAQCHYDRTAKSATVTAARDGMGALSIYYSSNDGSTWHTEAPKRVGTYRVAVNADEGDNYASATLLTDDAWTFTIEPPLRESRDDVISEIRANVGECGTRALMPKNVAFTICLVSCLVSLLSSVVLVMTVLDKRN